jgi:hypothetical protein
MTYEIQLLFPLIRLRIRQISLVSLVNTFQRHRSCREGVCLHHNKKTKDVRCRYYFPRQLLEAAGVTMKIDGKSWKFAPKRNDPRMNQCVAELVISWMANTDFQPATSISTIRIPRKACLCHRLMVTRAPSRSTTYLQFNTAFHPEISNNN